MKHLAAALVILVVFAKMPLRAQQRESEAERVKESSGITEHGPDIVWGWANFALLAAGLGYVIKKNAGPYFARRSLEIRKGLADADAARAVSDAKVAAVDRRLANLETEIEALRLSARQEAEADADRVRREATAEIAKIQSQLAEEVAAAGKSATLELRRYSAELALALAEQKIAARLSPETQDSLVGRFVTAVSQAAPGISGN